MINSKVHVYTGDGKGKTTCAFGLAVRAAGRNLKTVVVQFLKTATTGEVDFLLKNAKNIDVYRFEKEHGFTFSMDEKSKEVLKNDIAEAIEFIKRNMNNYDLIVLDEIICAHNLGFVSFEDILYIVKNRKNTEIVLTGCGADEKICAIADYVTQMKKIKHPYDNGEDARCGIEF